MGEHRIATSPSGWIDTEIFAAWFQDTFVPQAKKRRLNDKPILLNLDGHISHETDTLKEIAHAHDIIVFCFPSKTTHKTQPLDVGVFSALSRAWTSHVDRCISEGITIDRYNFIFKYMEVRTVITPMLIQKAFRKTGIHPLDPSVFSEKDFAPSQSSSTIAHMPPSYPAEIPSSPISAHSEDFSSSDSDTSDSEYLPSDGPEYYTSQDEEEFAASPPVELPPAPPTPHDHQHPSHYL